MDTAIAVLPAQPSPPAPAALSSVQATASGQPASASGQTPSDPASPSTPSHPSGAASQCASSGSKGATAAGAESADHKAAGTFAGALAEQLARGTSEEGGTGNPPAQPAEASKDKSETHEKAKAATPDALVALLAGAPLVPPSAPPPDPHNASTAQGAAAQALVATVDGVTHATTSKQAPLLSAASGSSPRALEGRTDPGSRADAQPAAHEKPDPAQLAPVELSAAHAHAPQAAAPTNPASPTSLPVLSPMQPAALPTAATASAAAAHIAAPVHSQAWGDALAQQVTFMVKGGEHTAQLRLNPPELGPLEVRVSVTSGGNNNVANAQFASPHAAVREALQAALPDLRTALASSGITLGNAWVGHGFPQPDSRESRSGASGTGGRGNASASADTAIAAVQPAGVTLARRGLVDTFA